MDQGQNDPREEDVTKADQTVEKEKDQERYFGKIEVFNPATRRLPLFILWAQPP